MSDAVCEHRKYDERPNFSDFPCPYCAKTQQAVVTLLKIQLGSFEATCTGKQCTFGLI